MKKIVWLAVFAILVLPFVSSAAGFRLGENPSINAGENVADDVYVFGSGVTSAGTVTGDAIMAGGNVIINGPIQADAIIGGGNVTLLSSVGDDARIGGGTLVIQGKIGDDLIAGGGQVTVGGPGIGGDTVLGGGVVRLEAPVSGNVRIGGGDIYINSAIAGNVIVEAKTLTLGSQAKISGNLTYKATKELTKEAGAVVVGETKFTVLKDATKTSKTAMMAIFSALTVWKFLTLLVCALIVGLFFRRYHQELMVKISQRPLRELGRGLLTVIVLPIISVLALITTIGWPFGILGFVGFVAVMIFAWIISPIVTGSFVYSYFSKREPEVSWKTIVIGVLIYTILSFIPFIGWLVQALIMLISLGALTAVKWDVIKQWR